MLAREQIHRARPKKGSSPNSGDSTAVAAITTPGVAELPANLVARQGDALVLPHLELPPERPLRTPTPQIGEEPFLSVLGIPGTPPI